MTVPPGAGKTRFVFETMRMVSLARPRATIMLRRSSITFAPNAERSRERPKRKRGRGRFTQREVTRFLKGAKKADPNATVKMNTDGSMVAVRDTPEPITSTENEWDQVR
jgi:hypothetical protein